VRLFRDKQVKTLTGEYITTKETAGHVDTALFIILLPN